jgi:hypothetical protein
MDPVPHAASRLDAAASRLAAASAALARLDSGGAGFEVPGRLGAVGRSAHARVADLVAAHARSAAGLAARMSEASVSLRTATGGYAGAESSAARRTNDAGSP